MIDEFIRQYNEAVYDMDRDRAMLVVNTAIARGATPEEIVFQIVIPGIESMVNSISERLNTSLAQHFMASQIASQITEEMLPRFAKTPEAVGRVVMGSAHGDFHALGKRIVIGCLKALMIEVADLGLNVAPHKFVDAAVSFDAQVIGISSMMVHTARGEQGCLAVRALLKERGLEDQIRVAVGGAPYRYDPGLYKIVKADAWAEDGITAGKVITGLIKEVKR
jgi:methanogenic corrinoid protein MtbC1